MPMPSTTMNTTTSMSDMPWQRGLVEKHIARLARDIHRLAGARQRHAHTADRVRLAKRIEGKRRRARAQGDIARGSELLRDLDHCRPAIDGAGANVVIADLER